MTLKAKRIDGEIYISAGSMADEFKNHLEDINERIVYEACHKYSPYAVEEYDDTLLRVAVSERRALYRVYDALLDVLLFPETEKHVEVCDGCEEENDEGADPVEEVAETASIRVEEHDEEPTAAPIVVNGKPYGSDPVSDPVAEVEKIIEEAEIGTDMPTHIFTESPAEITEALKNSKQNWDAVIEQKRKYNPARNTTEKKNDVLSLPESPEKDRTIINLWNQNYTVAGIAETMHLTKNNVYYIISKYRKKGE